MYLPDIKIIYGYEKLRLNNNILERSKDGIVWKSICVFNLDGQCCNYRIKENGCYCRKHPNGILIDVSTVKIGDATENWVFNILKESLDLLNIQLKGQENSKLDIIYQVKDEVEQGILHYRGIQVKTLKSNKNKTSFSMNDLKKYDNDTLIVGVDVERKYMRLILRSCIKESDSDTFAFNINKISSNIRPYIFLGLEDIFSGSNFQDNLIRLCKNSTIYDHTQFYENELNEHNMMIKLEELCKEKNLNFKINDTSDSSIDCFINNKRIQCKYSNSINTNLYSFGLKHSVNGKKNQPYSENDVDLFIFQHKNEPLFWVIPSSVLSHFGYLKTDTLIGKNSLNLTSLSYNKDDWTKKFSNRFDLIDENYDLSELINLDNFFDKFQHVCKINDIECIRDMSDLNYNNCFINNKTANFIKSTNKSGKNYYFQISRSNIAYHTNNIVPDFFIFRIEDYPDNFYIFPKEILIMKEIIGTGNIKGKSSFLFPIPFDNTNNRKLWCFDYLDKFDLLK